MSTREHPVAGRPEDWTHAGQAFRHLDGSSADWRTAQPAKDCSKRARDRKFKRALRNYRRNVRLMADEPHSFVDSWPFLIPFGLMCLGIWLARAWGLLP